jgi:hypothetical protein
VQYLGRDALEKAFRLARHLKEISGQQVIFKNLAHQQFTELKMLGCTDYKEGDFWNRHYKYDDDTFPEAVIDLKSLVSLKGKGFKTVRYRIRHFYSHNNYTVSNSAKEGALVVRNWLGMIKERYQDYLKEDPMILHSAEIHAKFAEMMNSGNSEECLAKIIHVNGIPKALAIACRILDACIGLYTNVTTDNTKGLSEAIVFEILKEAFEQGYLYANLGGSEFESLLKYKEKFKPVKYIQKTHAVLY